MLFQKLDILGLGVAITSIKYTTDFILQLVETNTKGYVCAANVHMCMEAYDDPEFNVVVNNAAIVVPDGKPLYWWMRLFGIKNARQVRGPDLFLSVVEAAANQNISVALFGGAKNTVDRLIHFLNSNYPQLDVVYKESPPFRKLTHDEEINYIEGINKSGARILFVGLGCPKQEKWMARHSDSINSVMLGIGAAFDFYAGTQNIAPKWMRDSGLEWLYRLLHEPQRLWKRYLKNNPRFIYHFIKAWVTKYLIKIV